MYHTCEKDENRIKNLRAYSHTWVIGSKYARKDPLQKHTYEPHILALDLGKKELGPAENTSVGRGLLKMAHSYIETVKICFYSAYYLAKNERPFRGYTDIIQAQQRNGQKFTCYLDDRATANFIDVVGEMLKNGLTYQARKCKYISILSWGSNAWRRTCLFVIYDWGKAEVKFHQDLLLRKA